MKTLNDYKALRSAFVYMLADNVGTKSIYDQILKRVESIDLDSIVRPADLPAISPEKLTKANAELGALNVEELYDVCCGDQDSCTEVFPDTGEVLSYLFEEIYS